MFFKKDFIQRVFITKSTDNFKSTDDFKKYQLTIYFVTGYKNWLTVAIF
jgi:hypothetical protein